MRVKCIHRWRFASSWSVAVASAACSVVAIALRLHSYRLDVQRYSPTGAPTLAQPYGRP